MTRGNQRERDRERAQARAAKNKKQAGHSAPKVGGKNSDAEALAAKIAMKKKLKEEGKLKEEKKDGAKKSKSQNLVNPHTGKRDPNYTKKMEKKGK